MSQPFITIAVQCHNFQRRLTWMLSSLCQQTAPRSCVIDVAHVANNGSPNTEAVLQFFAPHLHVKASLWDDYAAFQRRGLVRNRQLRECTTEWLLFADTDMVYHPEYLARLAAELAERHARATYMLSAGRVSNPHDETNHLVNQSMNSDATLIPAAFEQASRLPRIKRSNVGAGFSQLINVQHAPHSGYYVEPERNPDWDWDSRFQKARSDISFRRRIATSGGPRRKLPGWFSDNLIHLNHHRDNQFGYHLTEQR